MQQSPAGGRVARYWRHIAGLAVKEMRGELAKSAVRLIGGGVVAVLVYTGLLGIGSDKVVAAVVFVLAGLAVAFVWKLVTIPPRLYEWQLDRQAHRVAADELKQLLRDGRALLNTRAHDGPWWNKTLDWEDRVNERLASYSDAELTLFETITHDTPRRAIENTVAPPLVSGSNYNDTRLKAKWLFRKSSG